MSIPDYERPHRSLILEDAASLIVAPFSAILFWSAIVLPVLYLSLLVIGISDTGELLRFLGLVSLHVLALVGGRSHRRPAE